MEEVTAFLAALALAEALAPRVEEAVQRGEVTPDQQKQMRDRYEALRARGSDAFKGPGWEE